MPRRPLTLVTLSLIITFCRSCCLLSHGKNPHHVCQVISVWQLRKPLKDPVRFASSLLQAKKQVLCRDDVNVSVPELNATTAGRRTVAATRLWSGGRRLVLSSMHSSIDLLQCGDWACTITTLSRLEFYDSSKSRLNRHSNCQSVHD